MKRSQSGPRTYRLPNGLPVHFLSRTDTDMVYQEIFVEDVYRRGGITFRDGDCILDIGANTGLFLVFLNQVCKSGRIIAAEPVPAIFHVLRRNAELYNQLQTVLLNIGVSRAAGRGMFTFFPRISCASTMYPDDSLEEERNAREYILKRFDEHPSRPLAFLLGCWPDWMRRALAEVVRRYYRRRELVECPLKTVSQIIREQGVEQIDLLKIDAERSEFEILAGIDEADWSRIRQAAIEVHESGTPCRQVEALLRDRGFHVTEEGNPLLPNVRMIYARRNELSLG